MKKAKKVSDASESLITKSSIIFIHAFTSSVPERMYERVSVCVCVCVLFILIVITDERVRSAPPSDWILQTLAAAKHLHQFLAKHLLTYHHVTKSPSV
jgi:hypothetical protein